MRIFFQIEAAKADLGVLMFPVDENTEHFLIDIIIGLYFINQQILGAGAWTHAQQSAHRELHPKFKMTHGHEWKWLSTSTIWLQTNFVINDVTVHVTWSIVQISIHWVEAKCGRIALVEIRAHIEVTIVTQSRLQKEPRWARVKQNGVGLLVRANVKVNINHHVVPRLQRHFLLNVIYVCFRKVFP